MSNEPLSFGPWLKKRRQRLDLTQEELAQRAACSLSTLRKIEAGDLLPSKELARSLAVAAEVPESDHAAFVAFARDERRAELLPAFDSGSVLPNVPAKPPLPASIPTVSTQTSTQTGALPTPPASTPPASTPPASTPPVPQRGHLPTPMTSFIGRKDEMHTLHEMLANPNCSLLTIVGPGGIGKTRLSLATAQAMLDLSMTNFGVSDSATVPSTHNPQSKIQNPKFPDGVYFIPFVGVTAPEYMLSTIASAVSFSFANTGDPKQQLLNYLSEKSMLLVLDNLEHLLDGVDLLFEMLQAAPRLKLLTTSRERLALQGEWVFELPTLSTPPDEAAITKQVLGVTSAGQSTYSSIELFVERAQRAKQGFTLSKQNQAAVGEICRLVGGMPLAIELAASWTHMLSCEEIAKEIAGSLNFLAVNHRNLPERQRSVRATFDHSWRLLSPAEQQVMRCLSVFRGGFQRESAAAVAGATLPMLASLVNKSLVRRTETGRYDLHELIRQYAADHLSRDAQEETTTQDAHASYFLTLLAERQAWLCSQLHKAGSEELRREHENLRAAWLRAAHCQQFTLLRNATFSFWFFHEIRAILHEGEALFQSAAQRIASPTETTHHPLQHHPLQHHPLQQIVYAHLLANQAWFAFRIGQSAKAHLLLQQAVPILRQHDDQHDNQVALVDALWYLCVLGWFEGRLQEAESFAQEGIERCQALGLRWQWSMLLNSLGFIAHFQGDYQKAQDYFEQSLAIMRSLGDPRTTAVHLANLSWNNQIVGKISESKPLLREALQIAIELDDPNTFGLTLESMARIAFAEEEVDEAQKLIEEAIANFRKQVDTWHLSNSLNLLGWIHLRKEEASAAQGVFSESVQVSTKAQLTANLLEAMIGLATAQSKTNLLPLHLTVAHAVLLNPASTQISKEHAEALQKHLQAAFAPHQIEAAQSQAKTTSLEHLVKQLL